MPLYDFQCQECSKTFDKLVKSDTIVECPDCGSGQVTKLLSAPGVFDFKGNGYYCTDFKGK